MAQQQIGQSVGGSIGALPPAAGQPPATGGAGGFKMPGNLSFGDEVNVETLAERRYLWTARAFAIVTAVSFCLNVVLLLSMFQLLPLVRIEPFLLTFQNKNEQVVNIQPIGKDMRTDSLVTETMVREYVVMRNTFKRDLTEMRNRWMENGPIFEMSTPAVFTNFMDAAEQALALIKAKGLTRQVRVLNATETKLGLWQVEYELLDMTPEQTEPKLNYYTATLRIGYRKKRVRFDERLRNPLGFTVVAYTVTEGVMAR